ncbi:UDP-N-acetylglucosamine 1-carboxyvinyltransferase [Aspergillus venezuelensis]
MDQIRIEGPTILDGEVAISGSKNAALPILSVHNVPDLKDINTSILLLRHLGARVTRTGSSVHVDDSTINYFSAPHQLTKTIRASIWALGPLVARFGQGEVALPGGCEIGKRPVDMHLAGLEQLGARIDVKRGYVRASTLNHGRLIGARVVMDQVSVGATITVMSAATLAVGTTVIEKAAREPEVVDTANFLKALGARFSGAGGATTTITGVEHLGPNETCIYRVMPDRIEIGTFLVAAAVTGGKVLCRNFPRPDTLSASLQKLREAGAIIQLATKSSQFSKTAPYPGFPTDLQPFFTLLNLGADQRSSGTVTDTVFENRFRYIPELIRMGARAEIRQNGTTVICHGTNKRLSGALVTATDLRAAAALILAGCCAEGTTLVEGISLLDRGL